MRSNIQLENIIGNLKNIIISQLESKDYGKFRAKEKMEGKYKSYGLP